jgi:DNA-directed RNA polymerase subunit RPC12/RpoP
MRCKNCGSKNVTTQVINETSYRRGHGCLFTILFGIFYWAWLVVKWTLKLMIAILYLLLAAWIMVIAAAASNRQFKHPRWFKKMMQRKGKVYNEQTMVFVCNNCGYRWDA